MRTDRVLRTGALAGLLAASSAGCSTMNNTEKGAVAGGAIGTGVGLLAGAATGNPRTGAAIGGLVGGGLGAVAGNDQDRRDERDREVIQANATAAVQAQAQQRMGITDVIQMARSGHEDEVIINKIRETGSTFGTLSISDLDFLKDNGVSGRVIAEMQTRRAPSAIAPRVVVRDPSPTVIVHEPPPVYVVPRPYYPPRPRPVVFVGGHYHW